MAGVPCRFGGSGYRAASREDSDVTIGSRLLLNRVTLLLTGAFGIVTASLIEGPAGTAVELRERLGEAEEEVLRDRLR